MIYFRNDTKKWEGPVKITTKDGKKLYAVRNRKLLTINSDHATLAKFEGEFQKSTPDDNTLEESSSNQIHYDEGENNAMRADRSNTIQSNQPGPYVPLRSDSILPQPREVSPVSDTIQPQPSVPTEAPVHLSSRSWHDVQLEGGNGQGTSAPARNDVSQNEDLIMLINHSCTGDDENDDVCLATSTKKEPNLLIDCACPTTVAGEKWIMGFIEQFSQDDKQRVQV